MWRLLRLRRLDINDVDDEDRTLTGCQPLVGHAVLDTLRWTRRSEHAALDTPFWTGVRVQAEWVRRQIGVKKGQPQFGHRTGNSIIYATPTPWNWP